MALRSACSAVARARIADGSATSRGAAPDVYDPLAKPVKAPEKPPIDLDLPAKPTPATRAEPRKPTTTVVKAPAAPAAPAAETKPVEMVVGVAKAPSAEDLLKEELGAIKVRKAKGSKNITSGIANVTATFNNTIVSITDAKGNTVNVVKTDIACSNGVIHVIDGVLMP